MKLSKSIIFLFTLVLSIMSGCNQDEETKGPLKVAFKEFNSVLTVEGESDTVKLISSDNITENLTVTIGLSSLCNAIFDDYVIHNAQGEIITLSDASFNIPFSTGKETFFTVMAAEGEFPISTESLQFDLLSVENAKLNDSHLSFELLVGSGSGFFPVNYSNNFEDCSNFSIPEDFSVYYAEGSKTDRAFQCYPNDRGTALQVSSFGGESGITDAWLVSKRKFDFSGANSAIFTMDVISQFNGEGTLSFKWSSDYCGSGSPEDATWLDLDLLNSQLPPKGSNIKDTISASFSNIVGQSGYFAFYFKGATSSSSVTYLIDNFSLAEPEEVDNGNGNGNTASSFVTDFEDCSEDYATPNGFIEEFLTAKEDRGWGCRSFGVDDSRAVQASAFGGAEGEDNAWLIIEEALDFTSLSTVNFAFDMYSNFSGPGEVIVQYATDYSGSGSPESATWIPLSVINDAMPAAGSQEWTSINQDIAALGGKTVHIAFQFVGANNGASSSWAIDNLAINGDGASGGGNGGGGSTGSSYSTDFETCSEDYAVPSDFIELFLTDKEDRGWGCRAFGLDDSRAVQASAFGGAEGNDNAWLILSEKLDFTALSTVNFQFQMYSNFSGPGEVIVQYSTDYIGNGSPDAASWTAISALNNAMPEAGSQEWTAINENITELAGKAVYVAFQFVGANNGASSSWAIDNLAINDSDAFNGSGGGNGGGSGGGSGSTITQFDTDFESCSADYSTPEGFFEEFLTTKEDRGWGCRAFGIDDSRAVQASAFGGAEGEDHSWLIFEDKFDFTGETSVNVLFSIFSNFSGPGEVLLKYSTDYSGSGKPDAATWTSINQVNNAMPEAGSQTWTEIDQDVSELGGKTVYLAFEFVGANNGASSSWAIDNLAINNPGAF
jgi:hypothetical protein